MMGPACRWDTACISSLPLCLLSDQGGEPVPGHEGHSIRTVTVTAVVLVHGAGDHDKNTNPWVRALHEIAVAAFLHHSVTGRGIRQGMGVAGQANYLWQAVAS